MGRRKEGGKEGWEGVKEGREERKGGKKGKELVNVLVTGKEEKKKRFVRGSNTRPSACKADVITTTPTNQLNGGE